MIRPTLTIIAILLVVSVGACSLGKSARQATPTDSPQASGHAPQASNQPATATESHPNEPSSAANEIRDELHTPEKGTQERQAIMDALRGNQDVVFQVNYLKVHNGWAWVDTTPLDKSGRATAEGGPNLLHFETGAWKVKNLSKVPDDPDDPLGPEDASPTYVNNVMKTFPGVPRDIFPKASN